MIQFNIFCLAGLELSLCSVVVFAYCVVDGWWSIRCYHFYLHAPFPFQACLWTWWESFLPFDWWHRMKTTRLVLKANNHWDSKLLTKCIVLILRWHILNTLPWNAVLNCIVDYFVCWQTNRKCIHLSMNSPYKVQHITYFPAWCNIIFALWSFPCFVTFMELASIWGKERTSILMYILCLKVSC